MAAGGGLLKAASLTFVLEYMYPGGICVRGPPGQPGRTRDDQKCSVVWEAPTESAARLALHDLSRTSTS
eukprot:CAMPEP_0117667456 /NCGR_PEP_ID=MMETSP0804-20121206/10978_1 /TAXON_ID=1074897 /ORGANISM="Tetraselmis astigmatica, Strain CCMP880" /LENGTH=68 /DNA_ID=CAMNT_0005475187 /DNA_START=491 /DNA_END=698 /DNA_ORIENTATION=-